MTGPLTAELPVDVDGLTAEWMQSALRLRFPGVVIDELTVTEIIWGSATKVRVAIKASGDVPEGLPEGLCIKGGFDPRVREALGAATDLGTRTEAKFFRDVAPTLDVRLPRSWFADASDTQGIVVFDDLAAGGTEFGSPTSPWAPDRVEAVLRSLAELHAKTWGKPVAGVPVGSEPVRAAARHLFGPAHFDDHFATEGSFVLPDELQDREQLMAAYEALWAFDDAADHCMTHGDAHIGNAYVDEGGEPLLLDWANPSMGPWSSDVAYFLVGAMTVEDRRESELDLLKSYLEALHGFGGPRLDPDEALEDYRRHMLHGLIWTTVPAVMQSPENVAAMSERHVAAIQDHDPLSLLDS